MTSRGQANLSHSIFQRLLNHAREREEDFNLILSRYAVERLLYRLGVTQHAGKFVLKGASLFLVWSGQNIRPTRDADFLGFGEPEPSHVASVFADLCSLAGENVDGIRFVAESIRAEEIRENQEYGGVRVTMRAVLHNAQIPVQIDVGFGDAVTPGVEQVQFPTLLGDIPSPVVHAYPRYTMVAEKLEAMIRLGIANSRMKDFYDLWLLSRMFDYDGPTLTLAVSATMQRRGTQVPSTTPTPFTSAFGQDPQKSQQWRAFIGRTRLSDPPSALGEIVEEIARWLMPIVEAVRSGDNVTEDWQPGGPWALQGEASSHQ